MENLKQNGLSRSRGQDADEYVGSNPTGPSLLEGAYMKVVVISLAGTLISLLVYFTIPLVFVDPQLSLFCGGINLCNSGYVINSDKKNYKTNKRQNKKDCPMVELCRMVFPQQTLGSNPARVPSWSGSSNSEGRHPPVEMRKSHTHPLLFYSCK